MQPDAVIEWQALPRPPEGGAACFEFHRQSADAVAGTQAYPEQGFVVCFAQGLRAWCNRCPHAGSPLDWVPGRFFTEDGRHLVCHTHGALFDPLSGDCLAGPCDHGLEPLPLKVMPDRVLVPRLLRLDPVPRR